VDGRLLLILALLAACNRPVQPLRFQPHEGGQKHAATVRTPIKLTGIERLGAGGAFAQELRVPCASCHGLRESKPLPVAAQDLREFHAGLTLEHGANVCRSCHVEGRVDALRLASGETVPMTEVMTLCGQCHGPQKRDYDRGLHGGMRGHWDLTRGARERNSCVDCHDPHAPRFVGGLPVLPPRDRFLEPREGHPHG